MGERMFGELKLPVTIERDKLSISMTRDSDSIDYQRSLDGGTVEKRISATRKNVLVINPVEPVSTPKSVSSHLLIEFDRPIVMEPRSNCTVFLTFPLEIGVFLKHGKDYRMIDVFSLGPQKFTLYGEPTGGVICKYWPSKVHSSAPDVQPYIEGVLELKITNVSNAWHDVGRAVFSAHTMKIFHQDDRVFTKSTMKINDRGLGETDFKKEVPEMKKSLKVCRSSRLNITSTSYVMAFGL